MTGDQARDTVVQAIEVGYRRIDTAEQYGNEAAVGEGMRASGLAREELFVTTKFNAQWHGEELAQQACRAAAQRLGVDYIDLLLIHWPNPWLDRYVAAWRGLTKLLADGSVRAIGTSNFKPSHLDRLLEETGGRPGRQPDPARPHPRARGDPRVSRGPRHRHRGVEPARAGRCCARGAGDH